MSTFFFFLFYIILAALNKWQTHRHNYSPTCSFGYLSKARFTRSNFCNDLSLQLLWFIINNVNLSKYRSNKYRNAIYMFKFILQFWPNSLYQNFLQKLLQILFRREMNGVKGETSKWLVNCVCRWVCIGYHEKKTSTTRRNHCGLGNEQTDTWWKWKELKM